MGVQRIGEVGQGGRVGKKTGNGNKVETGRGDTCKRVCGVTERRVHRRDDVLAAREDEEVHERLPFACTIVPQPLHRPACENESLPKGLSPLHPHDIRCGRQEYPCSALMGGLQPGTRVAVVPLANPPAAFRFAA